MSRRPKVCIGLPVYNGQRFLDAAIKSIVAQDYRDFELIIADNCSEDSTLEIARNWAASDTRIKILTATKNYGAAANFNRLVAAAESEYFKWAAGDDQLAPTFLSKCVSLLEHRKDLALAFSQAVDIDETGETLGLLYDNAELAHLDTANPIDRFSDLVLIEHSCFAVFGLIRMNVLQRTPLIGPYVGSDRVLLARLGLEGRFARVEEPLMMHREHSGRSTRAIANLRDRAAWFDTSLGSKKTYPRWRILFEYTRSVLASSASLWEKAVCLRQLLKWVYRGNWRGLAEDLGVLK